MADALPPRNADALIVVDVQNDFVRGGALAVPGGDGRTRSMVSAPLGLIGAALLLPLSAQGKRPKAHR